MKIESLKKAVKVLLELRYNGIISGTLNDSTLTEISDSVDERLKPFILGDDDDDDSTERPNLSTESGKTINHITIKEGEYNDILKAYRIGNIIDKELVWCTDRNKMYVPYSGKLYPIGGTSSETIDNNTDIDMTDDRVLEILTELEKVSFVPLNALKDKDNNPVAKYSIRVDQSGKLMVYNSKNDDFQNYINVLKGGGVLPFTDGQTSGGDRFNDLYINSFFLGGNGDSHSRQACSHNFVELSNISDNDISLNGISLFYCGDSMGGDSWESIQLFGTIKAHSTFLIRGETM